MNPSQDTTKRMNDTARDFSAKSSSLSPSNLTEVTQGLGKQVGSAVSQFSDSASDIYAKGCDYVKANPVKGVAIAAATGLVVGSIISRMRN